jgi:glycine/D-amino acid oxidase-like deaminating enzyme/nitrite reductase/ring-hydroxylating ferredoxin subunit
MGNYQAVRSLWIDTTVDSRPSPPRKAVAVDVAILGGGILGITLAAELVNDGVKVAVIEGRRVLRGATGYTSAKVTAGHGLIYSRLSDDFGAEAASTYARAQTRALEHLRANVRNRRIDCDWEARPNFVYAESRKEVGAVRAEVAAAVAAGLPAEFVKECGLPFPIAGAVRLDQQAQFHPRKYLLALAASVRKAGGIILEDTIAQDVDDGEPCRVATTRGDVIATQVVVATHMPILDRGLFFAKQYQHRSYVVAGPIPRSRDPHGMYISGSQDKHSFRTARDGKQLVLLVGGEGHKAGQEDDTEARYAALEAYASEHFGMTRFTHRWSTQDNYTVDAMPYVGKMTPWSDYVFVGTGFNGWGMTGGTMAALLLRDLLAGGTSPEAELFDSTRVNMTVGARDLLVQNLDAGAHLARDHIRPAARPASELARGEGGIVSLAGRKVAAYRGPNGRLHAFSANCTHIGCVVGWNAAEQTFDCPCHGSRFSCRGEVFEGPATRDLKPIKRRGR